MPYVRGCRVGMTALNYEIAMFSWFFSARSGRLGDCTKTDSEHFISGHSAFLINIVSPNVV